jgi:hypothetical protein
VKSAVVVALAGCTGPARVMGRAEEPPPASAILAEAVADPEVAEAVPPAPAVDPCAGVGEVSRFVVAHINDMQARYGDLVQGRSRYAYVAGYLRALKAENPSTIVLDAGDDYEKGSIAELRSMGEATRRMIQALPIDARTIGNHDFAYGEEAVMRDALWSAHPVLAANVHRDAPGEDEPFSSFVRLDVGCVRVGITGLVTTNYGSTDLPTKEPFDGVFRQDDRYAEVLDAVVREHRAEVDVMIALDHLGFWQDVDLAGKVPGVDLFVGGHSEDLVTVPYGVQRQDGSRAWVLQAGHFARTLGRADLAWNRKDRTLSVERYGIVTVDESLPVAEDVEALARQVEHDAAPDARNPIAVLGNAVPAGKPMTDLVWRAVRERWGADAMLLGRDLFWDGLAKGPITLERLYDAVLVQREPAGTSGFSSLHLVSLTGAELAALRARLIAGPMFSFYAPDVLDPARKYRLVIEKRALENPSVAMYGSPSPMHGRWGGEIIDVLEPYARSRTARGLTLD